MAIFKAYDIRGVVPDELDAGIAVAINGEMYRDDRDVAIPENAEVFLLPRIPGG